MASDGKMTFTRHGRCEQLVIETAADLVHAVGLDAAHWVTTNAPTSTISFDPTFLGLLDADNRGRITCDEVKGAIAWLFGVLADHDAVTRHETTLRLAAINTEVDEGRRIHEAATKMLARLDRPDADEIALGHIRQIKSQVESTPVSEAGVVLPVAAQDEDIRRFVTDVLAMVGGAPHPSGQPGLSQAQLDRFLTEAAGHLDWHARGQIPEGQDRTDVMPLGHETTAAYDVLAAVRGKIDQYFAQCQALTLDERFSQQMGWTDAELGELDFDDPAVIEDVLRKAPLAKARPAMELDLAGPINPYYLDALGRFRRQVAQPALGADPDVLTALQWQQIKAFYAAHQAWRESKPSAAVEPLGAEKLRDYLAPRYADAVRALIGESTATALVLDNIRLTEKLALFQGRMIDFANNFVSFPHLYDADSRAMFEMGTLVMDGRRMSLAVKVDNRAQHAVVGKTSNMYLLYVEVALPDGSGTYEVAVPVTSGGEGNLCVGKRGVFYDVAGRECDARVVAVIDNPVSLREAMVSPLRRLGKLLTGKIESITTEAEKKLDMQASGAMDQVAPTAAGAKPAKPAPKPSSAMSTGGLLVGAGVATAALGSAVAYITKTLADTSVLAILVGVLVAVLLVMLPTSIIGALKLRKRDISAILEGSGWGINARMRLTRAQGKFFTRRPPYPKGAVGVRRGRRGLILTILVVLALLVGGGYLLREYVFKPPQATTQPASGQTGTK